MVLNLGPITDKKYPVTRSYKAHPKFGCPGPDLGTPMGTPLKAVVDGTIVSGVNPDVPGKIHPIEDWGKYIWLIYAKNKKVKFGYAHLSKFRVRSGKVKKGQVIAYSGNSGYSFGAHLHFAFSYYGKCIDPFNSSVVQWGGEVEEVTEIESKVKSFIYLYRAILNRHPSATQKKYFLYLAKKGIDPATWSRTKYFSPKIKDLNTTIKQQKAKLKTLAGQIKGLQDDLEEVNDSKDRLNGKVFSLEAKVEVLEEKLNACQHGFQEPVEPTEDTLLTLVKRFINWLKVVKIQ